MPSEKCQCKLFFGGFQVSQVTEILKDTPLTLEVNLQYIFIRGGGAVSMFVYILGRHPSVDPSVGVPLGRPPVCRHLWVRMCCVYERSKAVTCHLWAKNCLGREERTQTHYHIKVGRGGEKRLLLIMGLAADVLHESNSLQPVCFHGNRISNYWAQALPPSFLPTRWRLMNMNYLQPITSSFFFSFFLFLSLSPFKVLYKKMEVLRNAEKRSSVFIDERA